MTHIAMMRSQAEMQVTMLTDVVKQRCAAFNTIFGNWKIHSTFEDDHLKLKDTIGLDSVLWVIHPSTKRYYRTRVKKGMGEYASSLVIDCKANESEVYILQNLWRFHPFFIFLTAPAQYKDQVEFALSHTYQRCSTARNHLASEIFSVVEARNNLGFKWRIIVQGQLDGMEEEICNSVNKSVARGVAQFNKNQTEYYNSVKLGLPNPPLFNLKYCQFAQIERLTRKQSNSSNLLLQEFNQKNISSFLWIFSHAAAMNPKTTPSKVRVVAPKGSAAKAIAILCQSKNGVIGYRGQLHPNLKSAADMKHFAECTNNGVVIMGRLTWDSLPTKYKPLKNRVNVVLSRNLAYNPGGGVTVESDLRKAIENASAKYPHKDIFIIGGARIYQQALEEKLISEAIVTVSSTAIEYMPFDGNQVFNILPHLEFPDKSVQLPWISGDTATMTVYWAKVKL